MNFLDVEEEGRRETDTHKTRVDVLDLIPLN